MKIFTAFLAGVIFGVGLIVAGMANPAKVLGFLDISGNWDPSLALVMVGAIGIGLIAFSVAKRRPRTILGESIQLPTKTHLDKKLLMGSLIFGVGWGLAGICPGPSLVLLGAGETRVVIFIAAMLSGLGLASRLGKN